MEVRPMPKEQIVQVSDTTGMLNEKELVNKKK
jgi:hypothetical protein